MYNHNLTDRQKDQLLSFFAYYMPMEQRAKLMADLPRAYNAWCGDEIVKVSHCSDDRPAFTLPDKCEIHKAPWNGKTLP